MNFVGHLKERGPFLNLVYERIRFVMCNLCNEILEYEFVELVGKQQHFR